ncbi:tetratricopeptide repeat protein [Streptomyces phaeolivaceus]|uniref:Tetratricopeptide repeat protein n=1 Tax=Streptomyces phaeolivaceus TaxID=2653200 RepID=A0A5P8KJ39_9ACTN|nr:tetratricopeptide repeat protein [Streptomyces phaeolivaceus]
MEFRVLGPVEVWLHGQRLPPFPRKPTALLTAGLMEAGKLVSVDRLVDAVWGDRPPASAAKLVQGYVLRLRQVLHGKDTREVITTRPRGYVFEPEEGQLDLQLFQALLERAHRAAARGEHGGAADLFEKALGLWRGPALGAPTTPLLRAEATRLEEIRLATVERLLDARLDLGGGAELIGDLTGLVAEHPLRERLRVQLITALDRCGRRADALAAYRDGRRRLHTELGIEPGPELREVNARLLVPDRPGRPGRGGAAGEERARWEVRRPAPRAAPAPVQLPAAPKWLTGRETETARLEGALRDGGEHSRICVVHGMAGVGKTALTLYVAHRVATAFPDGQLHAVLGGGDPTRPADPAEILAGFLRALGIGPGQIPSSLPERAAAFRTVLAGLKALVVLDDAAGEEQVRSLLPGASSRSAVLISSRKALHGLDSVERVGLEVLDPAHAVRLLARLAGSDRTTAEPEAAAEIAQLSGGLPLALRIAGSRLRTRSAWPLGALAERLRDEHARLDEMASGDLDVRAGIEVSYRALPEPERLVFRRLGMLESPDLAPWVAAPLADIDMSDAERLVDRLADAHLLEPLGADHTGRVRYRFHDLVRLYARERADLEDTRRDRSSALSRLLRTWLALSRRAGDLEPTGLAHLVPRRAAGEADTALGERLLADPRAWLQAEHGSLVAGVVLAARLDLLEEACDLASVLVQASFRVNNQFDEWQRTHDAALAAVRRAANPRGEAVLLTGLGQLRYEQDRFDEADRYFREALAGFVRLGDIGGQATALAGIAVVGKERGNFTEATACLEQALSAFEALGDAAGAAGALYDLGAILREKGNSEEATAQLRKALAIHRSIGSRRGEGLVLRAIGLVHRADGDLARAEEQCARALDLLRSVGDRLMEAYAVQALAKVRFRLRPDDTELPALLGALRVCRELDDVFGEALLLRTLGELHLAQGRVDHASACLRQALDLWTRLRHPLFRARTLRDLSRLHELLGDRPGARALRQEALLTFRRYGTREYAELRAVEETDPSAVPGR